MNVFVKSTAIAALLASASAPVFAMGHLDPMSTTCAEFKAMSPEDQSEIAMMAVAATDASTMPVEGGPTDGEAKAVDATGGTTTAEEADSNQETTIAPNEGTATATDGDHGADDMTMTGEDLQSFMISCDRNLDATVSEAAAGLEGTR